MDADSILEKMRALRVSRGGTSMRYPAELKEAALSYFEANVSEKGAEATALAIGTSLKTIRAWQAEAGLRQTSGRFFPVTVLHKSKSKAAGVVVFGPHGLRVEGLDVPSLVELFSTLS